MKTIESILWWMFGMMKNVNTKLDKMSMYLPLVNLFPTIIVFALAIEITELNNRRGRR